ncbi:hypothetical protein B0H15DRAFT_807628 [Mycena belliarum]|uniref:Uncharacterized protein n=1 Tax=Mycena belliarum TaxID=1033014 RepID=A0AAD6TKZ5_9AGAR|nr:hypothetical protein B0H15DRAFT_807628 [Mycena belliae]
MNSVIDRLKAIGLVVRYVRKSESSIVDRFEVVGLVFCHIDTLKYSAYKAAVKRASQTQVLVIVNFSIRKCNNRRQENSRVILDRQIRSGIQPREVPSPDGHTRWHREYVWAETPRAVAVLPKAHHPGRTSWLSTRTTAPPVSGAIGTPVLGDRIPVAGYTILWELLSSPLRWLRVSLASEMGASTGSPLLLKTSPFAQKFQRTPMHHGITMEPTARDFTGRSVKSYGTWGPRFPSTGDELRAPPMAAPARHWPRPIYFKPTPCRLPRSMLQKRCQRAARQAQDNGDMHAGGYQGIALPRVALFVDAPSPFYPPTRPTRILGDPSLPSSILRAVASSLRLPVQRENPGAPFMAADRRSRTCPQPPCASSWRTTAETRFMLRFPFSAPEHLPRSSTFPSGARQRVNDGTWTTVHMTWQKYDLPFVLRCSARIRERLLWLLPVVLRCRCYDGRTMLSVGYACCTASVLHLPLGGLVPPPPPNRANCPSRPRLEGFGPSFRSPWTMTWRSPFAGDELWTPPSMAASARYRARPLPLDVRTSQNALAHAEVPGCTLPYDGSACLLDKRDRRGQLRSPAGPRTHRSRGYACDGEGAASIGIAPTGTLAPPKVSPFGIVLCSTVLGELGVDTATTASAFRGCCKSSPSVTASRKQVPRHERSLRSFCISPEYELGRRAPLLNQHRELSAHRATPTRWTATTSSATSTGAAPFRRPQLAIGAIAKVLEEILCLRPLGTCVPGVIGCSRRSCAHGRWNSESGWDSLELKLDARAALGILWRLRRLASAFYGCCEPWIQAATVPAILRSSALAQRSTLALIPRPILDENASWKMSTTGQGSFRPSSSPSCVLALSSRGDGLRVQTFGSGLRDGGFMGIAEGLVCAVTVVISGGFGVFLIVRANVREIAEDVPQVADSSSSPLFSAAPLPLCSRARFKNERTSRRMSSCIRVADVYERDWGGHSASGGNDGQLSRGGRSALSASRGIQGCCQLLDAMCWGPLLDGSRAPFTAALSPGSATGSCELQDMPLRASHVLVLCSTAIPPPHSPDSATISTPLRLQLARHASPRILGHRLDEHHARRRRRLPCSALSRRTLGGSRSAALDDGSRRRLATGLCKSLVYRQAHLASRGVAYGPHGTSTPRLPEVQRVQGNFIPVNAVWDRKRMQQVLAGKSGAPLGGRGLQEALYRRNTMRRPACTLASSSAAASHGTRWPTRPAYGSNERLRDSWKDAMAPGGAMWRPVIHGRSAVCKGCILLRSAIHSKDNAREARPYSAGAPRAGETLAPPNAVPDESHSLGRQARLVRVIESAFCGGEAGARLAVATRELEKDAVADIELDVQNLSVGLDADSTTVVAERCCMDNGTSALLLLGAEAYRPLPHRFTRPTEQMRTPQSRHRVATRVSRSCAARCSMTPRMHRSMSTRFSAPRATQIAATEGRAIPFIRSSSAQVLGLPLAPRQKMCAYAPSPLTRREDYGIAGNVHDNAVATLLLSAVLETANTERRWWSTHRTRDNLSVWGSTAAPPPTPLPRATPSPLRMHLALQLGRPGRPEPLSLRDAGRGKLSPAAPEARTTLNVAAAMRAGPGVRLGLLNVEEVGRWTCCTGHLRRLRRCEGMKTVTEGHGGRRRIAGERGLSRGHQLEGRSAEYFHEREIKVFTSRGARVGAKGDPTCIRPFRARSDGASRTRHSNVHALGLWRRRRPSASRLHIAGYRGSQSALVFFLTPPLEFTLPGRGATFFACLMTVLHFPVAHEVGPRAKHEESARRKLSKLTGTCFPGSVAVPTLAVVFRRGSQPLSQQPKNSPSLHSGVQELASVILVSLAPRPVELALLIRARPCFSVSSMVRKRLVRLPRAVLSCLRRSSSTSVLLLFVRATQIAAKKGPFHAVQPLFDRACVLLRNAVLRRGLQPPRTKPISLLFGLLHAGVLASRMVELALLARACPRLPRIIEASRAPFKAAAGCPAKPSSPSVTPCFARWPLLIACIHLVFFARRPDIAHAPPPAAVQFHDHLGASMTSGLSGRELASVALAREPIPDAANAGPSFKLQAVPFLIHARSAVPTAARCREWERAQSIFALRDLDCVKKKWGAVGGYMHSMHPELGRRLTRDWASIYLEGPVQGKLDGGWVATPSRMGRAETPRAVAVLPKAHHPGRTSWLSTRTTAPPVSGAIGTPVLGDRIPVAGYTILWELLSSPLRWLRVSLASEMGASTGSPLLLKTSPFAQKFQRTPMHHGITQTRVRDIDDRETGFRKVVYHRERIFKGNLIDRGPEEIGTQDRGARQI